MISHPSATQLRVANSVFRGMVQAGGAGIFVQDNVNADISSSKFFNNGWVAVWAHPLAAGNATVSISDVVAAGNTFGFRALGTLTSAKMTVTRSTASQHSGYAVGAEGGSISLSYSTVTFNAFGLQASGGGTLESQGNNTVRQNTTNTIGTITTFSGT